MASSTPPDAATLTLVLERVRRRLLDLSARNRLLNYRHPKASSLRIVGAQPELVFARLLEQAPLSFDPLPKMPEHWVPRAQAGDTALPAQDTAVAPAARAKAERTANSKRRDERRKHWAEEQGIPTSFDPATNDSTRRPSRLQTLLFPEELEAQLRHLQRQADTAIEETGANQLHLLFGFVEWMDSPPDGGTPVSRLAPLVLVPVQLKRGQLDAASHAYRYALERTGEDWSVNVTLQQKCRVDFRFELPDLDADEPDLDSYFDQTERLLATTKLGWRLHRHLSLGLVSFGRILMWRDLDPKTWPPTRPIFESRPLRTLLGARDSISYEAAAAKAESAAEYDIDTLDDRPDSIPATIIEADSSQHSALIDIDQGKDLVLQGPPGTGKSQTITNLIAAMLRKGRSVLFVAEKKAALDVVASRLKDAGLADYCVSLHSHSTAKREFIADLDRRLSLRSNPPHEPTDLKALLQRLRDDRITLSATVQALHAPFGAIGLSPFEVMWRAQRASAQLPPSVLEVLRGLHLPYVTQQEERKVTARRDVAQEFARAFEKVCAQFSRLDQHPWSGLRMPNTVHSAVEDLRVAARAWLKALTVLEGQVSELAQLVDGWVPDTIDALRVVRPIVDGLTLPDRLPDDLMHRIVSANVTDRIPEAVAAVQTVAERQLGVRGQWRQPGVFARRDDSHVEQVLRKALGQFGGATTLDALRDLLQRSLLVRKRIVALTVVSDSLVTAYDIGPQLKQCRLEPAAGPLRADVALALVTIADTTLATDPMARGLLHDGTRGAAPALRDLATQAQSLLQQERELADRYPLSFRPPLEKLRSMAVALATAPSFLPALFSSEYRQSVRLVRAMAGGNTMTRPQMLQAVRQLVTHADAIRDFLAHPILARVFRHTPLDLKVSFPAAIMAAEWHDEIARAIASLPRGHDVLSTAFQECTDARWSALSEAVRGAGTDWAEARHASASLIDAAALLGQPLHELMKQPLQRIENDLVTMQELCSAVLAINEVAQFDGSTTLSAVQQDHTALRNLWKAEDALQRYLKLWQAAGVAVAGASTDVQTLQGAAQFLAAVRNVQLPKSIQRWVLGPGTRERLAKLREHVARVDAALATTTKEAKRFATLSDLDEAIWYHTTQSSSSTVPHSELTPLTQQRQRLEFALEHEGALAQWALYMRTRSDALSAKLHGLVELIEAGKVPVAQAATAYDAAVYRALTAAALDQVPALDAFDSGRHGEVRRRFSQRDAEREQLERQAIAAALAQRPPVPGRLGPRVGEMSEEALIRHQANLQKRHVSIRELFRRAGRAIQNLKPCFLMGPQAVAQYLPPGEFEFDLVVMDEASQMRPEDALGAIARGRQVLIVGDPMQLGPSAFFDRSSWDDDDDVETDEAMEVQAAQATGPLSASAKDPRTVVEREESILLAAAACFPQRMLRWHYRSRHPFLIDFSGRNFYNRRLIVFPTPGAGNAPDGVLLTRVVGDYANRENPAEAAAIVEAVRRHAREWPERTLLVATLNKEQASLIDDLVEEAEKEDEVLARFRARHADSREPFTIKNLENVQGDERDHILVSVTFGPDQQGRLLQHFGPINQVGGERRLNVLFTRAKHRLEVFCSFDPQELRVTEQSPRGLKVLRDYLLYAAASSNAGPTGQAPHDDAELSVAEALQARGYDVRAQVGVSGCTVDLAVVDPADPSRFLLGIEFDGRSYREARSTRDRDRLRQRQLESLGWHLHRVWSIDWFKDPAGELQRILRRLQSLEATRR